MRVYLDNMLVSAAVRGDLALPAEMNALRTLKQYKEQLEIVTSRESWREQERTRDVRTREQLHAERGSIPVVPNDHKVLGFASQEGPRGTVCAYPLVTDVPDDDVWRQVQEFGLKRNDARHLLYALCNGCDRFVTTDPDFFSIRDHVSQRFPSLRIVEPSELLQEQTNAQGA